MCPYALHCLSQGALHCACKGAYPHVLLLCCQVMPRPPTGQELGATAVVTEIVKNEYVDLTADICEFLYERPS